VFVCVACFSSYTHGVKVRCEYRIEKTECTSPMSYLGLHGVNERIDGVNRGEA